MDAKHGVDVDLAGEQSPTRHFAEEGALYAIFADELNFGDRPGSGSFGNALLAILD
jgi:hypothetical protein